MAGYSGGEVRGLYLGEFQSGRMSVNYDTEVETLDTDYFCKV